jgi:hypothetical protein
VFFALTSIPQIDCRDRSSRRNWVRSFNGIGFARSILRLRSTAICQISCHSHIFFGPRIHAWHRVRVCRISSFEFRIWPFGFRILHFDFGSSAFFSLRAQISPTNYDRQKTPRSCIKVLHYFTNFKIASEDIREYAVNPPAVQAYCPPMVDQLSCTHPAD